MADPNGIYRKFIVRRTDGSSEPGGKHESCAYFVLDLEHDEFAIPALKAYAKACRKTHPLLADDIATIVDAEPRQCGCREAACPHAQVFGPASASEMASQLMGNSNAPKPPAASPDQHAKLAARLWRELPGNRPGDLIQIRAYFSVVAEEAQKAERARILAKPPDEQAFADLVSAQATAQLHQHEDSCLHENIKRALRVLLALAAENKALEERVRRLVAWILAGHKLEVEREAAGSRTLRVRVTGESHWYGNERAPSVHRSIGSDLLETIESALDKANAPDPVLAAGDAKAAGEPGDRLAVESRATYEAAKRKTEDAGAALNAASRGPRFRAHVERAGELPVTVMASSAPDDRASRRRPDDVTATELESALSVILRFRNQRPLPKLPGLLAEALLLAAKRDIEQAGLIFDETEQSE